MLNKVIIMGRLTKTPELKTTNSDVKFCQFSVAVDREYGDRKPDFINCVAWRGTAEFISNYFTKGQLICCEGRLENNPYEKDGQKRDSWSVKIDSAYFCGGKSESSNTTAPVSVEWEDLGGDDGELPF